MTAFLYPKTRHVRTQTPPLYSAYKRFKPFLRVEFEARCIYCREADAIRGHDSFGVDHYRPKRDFPHLESEYLNLFYCCNPCNSRKGKYWPKPALESTEFLPNPCEHEMFRHLRYQGPMVEARSRAGEIAVDLLRLNDAVTVKRRATTIQAIDSLEVHAALVIKLQESVATRRERGVLSQVDADQADSELAATWARIASALADYGVTLTR